jgi:AcrR family transcriptional regulator
MARSLSAHAAPDSKTRRRRSTRDQILDSAEELFARYGMHDVMLKDVTDHVGVDPTLLHYYFKDKGDLFNAVASARVPITSASRLAALDAYATEAAGKPTIEGALRAYLETDAGKTAAGAMPFRNFGNLCAQMSKVPGCQTGVIDAEFDPVVLRLIDLLCLALPDCTRDDVLWGYHFLSGALMLTLARGDRLARLSGNACDGCDVSAARERLISFCAGGFRHMCEMRRQARVIEERKLDTRGEAVDFR